jgi:hypothetical protein
MMREGGHFIVCTHTKDWREHGFCQFSRELFLNVFCADDGFEGEHLDPVKRN